MLLNSITQTLIGSGIGVLSDYNLLLLFQFPRPTAAQTEEGLTEVGRVRMGRLMNSGGKLTFLLAAKWTGQIVISQISQKRP